MKRSDEINLNRVGKFLLDNYSWVTSTAMTQNEDYVTDITITTDSATTHNLEVKTIRGGKKPYKSNKIRVSDDDIWKHNFWMLNKTGYGGVSKWQKFLDHVYDGLIFYDEMNNFLYMYNYKDLMNAYLGDIELLVSHTTDFKDQRKTFEKKVAIDLDRCTKKIAI